MASSVEESNKLSAAQWGLCSMEVVIEVQVDFIQCSNKMSYSISGIFIVE